MSNFEAKENEISLNLRKICHNKGRETCPKKIRSHIKRTRPTLQNQKPRQNQFNSKRSIVERSYSEIAFQ